MLRRWKGLSMGERATIIAEGGLHGVVLGRDVIPPHWIVREATSMAKGEHAVGKDAVRAREERKVDPDPDRKVEPGEKGRAEEERARTDKKPGGRGRHK
jgi:hypothetical protein